MELKERLKLARKNAGITQAQVAEAINGLSQPAYSELERGVSKSTSKIVELASLYKVNPEWLSSGIGDMVLDNQHIHASQVNSGNFHNSQISQNVNSPLINYKAVQQDLIDIPLYQNANIAKIGTYPVSKYLLQQMGNPSTLFAVPVVGRDMQPLLMDKAMVVADESKAKIGIVDGQIYALQIGENIRCRYLGIVWGGRVRVYSEQNKDGEILDQAEFDKHFKVLGGIVWQSSFFGW